MLVQSYDGAISLLPALPDAWPDGYIKGVRTRGGFEITDMKWEKGKLVSVTLKSTIGGNMRLRSATKLRGSGLVVTSGENSNPLFQRSHTFEPIISSKASLKGTGLGKDFEYDINTRTGGLYTVYAE